MASSKGTHSPSEEKIYYSIGGPRENGGRFACFPGAILGECSNLRAFTRMLVKSIPIGAKIDIHMTRRSEKKILGEGYYLLTAEGLIEREPPDELASGLVKRINACLPKDWQWEQEARHLFFWEHASMNQQQALALAEKIREDAPSLKRVRVLGAGNLFQHYTTYLRDGYVCEIAEKPSDPKSCAYIQSEERWERYKHGNRHAYPVKEKQGPTGV